MFLFPRVDVLISTFLGVDRPTFMCGDFFSRVRFQWCNVFLRWSMGE